MAFAQVTYRESLATSRLSWSAAVKIVQHGLREPVAKSTLPMPTSYVIGAYGSIWPLSSSNERVNFM